MGSGGSRISYTGSPMTLAKFVSFSYHPEKMMWSSPVYFLASQKITHKHIFYILLVEQKPIYCQVLYHSVTQVFVKHTYFYCYYMSEASEAVSQWSGHSK